MKCADPGINIGCRAGGELVARSLRIAESRRLNGLRGGGDCRGDSAAAGTEQTSVELRPLEGDTNRGNVGRAW